MKASCITIHRVVNFGSVLQTFATQILWEKVGVHVTIIDYIPKRLQFGYRLRLLLRNRNLTLKKKVAIFLTMDLINRCIFNRFVKKHINLSAHKYKSLSELKGNYPIMDFYMTGSDQVWNSYYNGGIDGAYFLTFLPTSALRISFISSFGRSTVESAEKAEMRKYLSEYKFISVRENSASSIIGSMGLNTPAILLDPTLQISKDEWLSIFPPQEYDRNYVLIYPMSFIEPELFTIARKIANSLGYEVWCLSPGMKNYNKECDKTLLFQGPEDFISLISQARFVVTNSFHGTAFAINFGIRFVTVMPYDFRTRIESLLGKFNLKNRIYYDNSTITASLEMLDDTFIQSILNEERSKCFQFILKIKNQIKLQ